MWHCTQWWPSLCPIYVCTPPREQNTRRGWKKMIKQLVNFALGLLHATTGVSHLSGREREREGGGVYSHASYSKVVGLHVLNVEVWKWKRYFSWSGLSAPFSLSYRCSTTDLRPLGRTVFLWSDTKVLQSQVFVLISTGINRLSRQRSRPSAITGPVAELSTCLDILTK